MFFMGTLHVLTLTALKYFYMFYIETKEWLTNVLVSSFIFTWVHIHRGSFEYLCHNRYFDYLYYRTTTLAIIYFAPSTWCQIRISKVDPRAESVKRAITILNSDWLLYHFTGYRVWVQGISSWAENSMIIHLEDNRSRGVSRLAGFSRDLQCMAAVIFLGQNHFRWSVGLARTF